MHVPRPQALRANNRLLPLLDAAAREFASHGYAATTTRAIAKGAAMTPGAIYTHFPSKHALLLAVYAEAVARIEADVDQAVAGESEPWAHLEAAVRAHLEAVVDRDDYARVVTQITPEAIPEIAAELRVLRNGYEQRFRRFVAELNVRAGVNERYLRLLLLGALNWSPVWHEPRRGSLRDVAAAWVAMLRDGCAA
jgi:AcrR family transcriptional regulator